jgi:tetratricopeptide (TPR) repeat protein
MEKMGDKESAIRDFGKAIELNPKNNSAFCNRGDLLTKRQQFAPAIVDFTASIEIDDSEYAPFCGRSMARLKNGDTQGALADAREAIRLNPKNVECNVSYGYITMRTGDRASAFAALATAIDLSADPSAVLSIRASFYMETGDLDKMHVDIERVLALNPSYSIAYIQLGHFYRLKGRYSDALSAYRTAESMKMSIEQREQESIDALLMSLRLVSPAVSADDHAMPDDNADLWSESIDRFVRGNLAEDRFLTAASTGASEWCVLQQTAEAY